MLHNDLQEELRVRDSNSKNFVMAGPRAGHPADSRTRGEKTWLVSSSKEPLRRVDTRRLGGRVALRLPGHDEIFMAFEFEPDSRGLDPATGWSCPRCRQKEI